MSWARVNGMLSALSDARIPANDVGFLSGWTVFETLRTVDAEIPLLALHLARLAESARSAHIPMPAGLEEECRQLASKVAGPGRIRITLSGSGLRIVSIEPVPTDRFGTPVRCVTGPFVPDPFLSGAVKHGSRAGWVVAVKRSGVDDVLFVDQDGRFTEGTTCGVLAVREGAAWTAPHDGRVLPSTTVSTLVDLAAGLGIPVVRQGALAEGPWEGLYIASATRGLAPVTMLDGRTLPTGDPVRIRLAAALAAHAGLR